MKRQPGGVPRTIDYLHSCLRRKKGRRSTERAKALLEVAALIRLVNAKALRGDPECVYFLAELLPSLLKSEQTIAQSNATFSTKYAEIRSAHCSTAKDSPLRKMIDTVIIHAQHEQRLQQVLQYLPEASVLEKVDNKLLMLPEFCDSDEAVTAWTNVVVYPRLRRKHRQLRKLYDEGKLQKARDENGKFQISRLKPLIRQTVARIAKLPQIYYFRVA